MSDEKALSRPTVEELEVELKRLKAARKRRRIWIIGIVAALIVVIAALYFSTMRFPSAGVGDAGMAAVIERGGIG